jgi:hypothetical protein
MRHVLEKHAYDADILAKSSGLRVARVYGVLDQAGLHPVCDTQDRLLFAVRCIEDAVPELEEYFGERSGSWKPVYHTLDRQHRPKLFINRAYSRELSVRQDRAGNWFALRDGEPLLCADGMATFRTRAAAQEVAEQHVRDPLCRSSSSSDGFWWRDPQEERELERKVERLLAR